MSRITALMVVAVLALAGCAGGVDDAAVDDGGAEAAGAPAEPASGDEGSGAEAADASADDTGAREAGAGGDGAVDPLTSTALAATATDRIVRDGTMRLRVDEDTFDQAFSDLVGLADRFGGTVLASDATTADDGSTSGTLTLRVPAEEFDGLLVAVGRVGEVEQRSITSEDASAEFVDLEARLRHNRAQERFYLSLLDQAEDVDDAIAVQQQVDSIQETIERLEGRLRFLEERTTFSRLTIEVVEVGGAPHTAGGQPSLAAYWATARAALINVLGGTLVVATVALPFALVALLIFVALRRTGIPARRAATPEA
jgi:hypothetical protein